MTSVARLRCPGQSRGSDANRASAPSLPAISRDFSPKSPSRIRSAGTSTQPYLYRAVVTSRAPAETILDDETIAVRHPPVRIRRRHRLLAERKKFQAQRRLRPPRRQRVRRRRADERVGTPPQRAAPARRQRHPHRAQSAGAGVSRSLRPHGLPRDGRVLRLLDRGQESVTTTTCISTNGRSSTRATPFAAIAIIPASFSTASATKFTTRPKPSSPKIFSAAWSTSAMKTIRPGR